MSSWDWHVPTLAAAAASPWAAGALLLLLPLLLLLLLCARALLPLATTSRRARRRPPPVVGPRSAFDPRLSVNYRFFRNAAGLINEGYARFTHTPWVFPRADVDILVLPLRYVDELRGLPSTVASPTKAHAHNLMGSHTSMDIILRNNLHFRTLVERLTPNLNSLTRPMQDELDLALPRDLPAAEGEPPRPAPPRTCCQR